MRNPVALTCYFMMAAASFATFDATALVEPAGGLRQEALGRLLHQAPPETGLAAADSLWDELKNRRILFTPSSALLLGGVLDTLLLALGSAPPATGVSNVRCQYTSGVLALATESFGGFPVGALHAMKSGLRDHRLLIIVAETNGGPDDQASVRTSVARKLAGTAEVDHSPAVAASAESFEASLSKLNAFLTWLRTALGTFRAKLPATTGSPSVVARLRFVAAERSFYLEPAAAGNSDVALLVPPPVLRRMMAPGPAPPVASGAPFEGAGSAPVGEKRSRAAYEAQQGALAAGAAAHPSSGAGRGGPVGGPAAGPERVSLAIIVPYRNQPLQNREPQLLRFAEAMPRFLSAVLPPLADFHIFIVEQSEDGYKFNRGKTLNIGFALATDPQRAAKYGVKGAFNAVCFHDVDLLPQPRIGEWYSRYPSRPLHIGGAWPRYARDNETYVGGITTLSTADFERINGCVSWRRRSCRRFDRCRRSVQSPTRVACRTLRVTPPDVQFSQQLLGLGRRRRRAAGPTAGGRPLPAASARREFLRQHCGLGRGAQGRARCVRDITARTARV
jgi:hypothetical protein